MKIHFIGIGGIGVSALAQYYLARGHEISGSDLAPSEITGFLQKKGVRVYAGNAAGHVAGDVDLVIHSPAVRHDNPEYVQAKKLGIARKSYPEALGDLTRQFFTIAVSGSHGKSTTTSMVALILEKAGLDPTVIVGTKLKEFGDSNFRAGKSNLLVIEACEYDGSFLNYNPRIIVITNIDREHLDYFKTFANVVKAFRQFIMRLPGDGFAVLNGDDAESAKLKANTVKLRNAIVCRMRQPEAGKLKKLLKIPGAHNVSNALAALSVARILGVKDAVSLKALAGYRGSWRRFEIKKGVIGKKKITVVSDYGHHPNEVATTLKAAREKYPRRQIWCIFQPHQRQRTHYLFHDFVDVLRSAPVDMLIVTDIYDVAGREEQKINASVSAAKLVQKVARTRVRYLPLAAAETYVREFMPGDTVLIIMGAGTIYRLADAFSGRTR